MTDLRTTPPRALTPWVVPAAAGAALVAGIYTIALPRGSFDGALVTLALGLVAALLWVGSGVLEVRARRRRRVRVLPLVALPAAVLVGLVLVVTGLPLRTHLALIGSELTTVADRAAAGDLTPSRAGLVDLVPRGRNADGCDVVEVPEAGFLGPAGFARCAAEPAVSSDASSYRSLHGGWYVWTGDF